MFRILHLSDIHIGKTYKDPENIACQIASDIDYVGLSNINCIIVTGDIFDGQIDVSDSLIDAAVNFLRFYCLKSIVIKIKNKSVKMMLFLYLVIMI